MDILSKLPFLKNKHVPETEEEGPTDAELKAERIRFHREKVRNGPVNFKTPTTGQIRRAQRRDLDRRTRKARRGQVQNYFATQQLGAVVRAHLQAAGVLPYVHERPLDLQQQVVSAAWLIQRFGVPVMAEDGVTETDEMSFAYFDVLTALGAALKFYGQTIGRNDLQIPEGYEVPIYEQGTEPIRIKGWAKDGVTV